MVTKKPFVDMITPFLLTGLLGVLGWIGTTLQAMKESYAVAIYRLDALEKTGQRTDWRIRRLETKETDRPESGTK